MWPGGGAGDGQGVCALGPDSDGALLHGLVEDARKRLDIAVYEVGPSFIRDLVGARRRGARVRILVDAHDGANRTTAGQLRRYRIPFRADGHAGHELHWKLLCVDDATVAVGSGNLIRRDAPPNPVPPAAGRVEPGTREWWVTVEGSAALARRVRSAMAAAWRAAAPAIAVWPAPAVPRVAPPIGVPDVLVPPLAVDVDEAAVDLIVGGAEVAGLLRDRIAAARQRVLAIVPYAHCNTVPVMPLLDALDAATRRGLAVRLLLGQPPSSRDAAELARRRFDVAVMDPIRTTTGHAKGLVADQAAVVGSANWSGSGLGANREAALLIDASAVAEYFAATHEHDWRAATPLPR